MYHAAYGLWDTAQNVTRDVYKRQIYNSISGAISKVAQWGTEVKNKAVEGMNMVLNGITNVFSNIGSTFAEIGGNIVSGIWNGISSGWDWLKDKVSNIASSLLDAAKDALGIESPSKKFRDEVGKFMEMCIRDRRKRV